MFFTSDQERLAFVFPLRLSVKYHTNCFCCFNVQDSNPAVIQCRSGKVSKYVGRVPSGARGNYSARVRAITPAGNGSWSNTVAFSLTNKEDSTSEFYNRLVDCLRLPIAHYCFVSKSSVPGFRQFPLRLLLVIILVPSSNSPSRTF